MRPDNWVKPKNTKQIKQRKSVKTTLMLNRRLSNGVDSNAAGYFNLCENIEQTNKSTITNNNNKNKYYT